MKKLIYLVALVIFSVSGYAQTKAEVAQKKADKTTKAVKKTGKTEKEKAKKAVSKTDKTIQTGPKGGKYYVNSKGNKVYVKK